MFGLRYLRDVTTLTLDPSKCDGCRMCVIVCPHAVFVVRERKASIVDKDACMECGACSKNCQQNAIYVESGVGCASGIIQGAIKGTEPACGCDTGQSSCCS